MAITKRAYVPDPKRHYISYKKAKELVSNYQQSLGSLLKKGVSIETFPISELFAKEAVMALLKQRNCAGLRIYGGMTKKGIVVYVLIGVNKNAENINGRAVVLPKPNTKMLKAAYASVTMYSESSQEEQPVILEEGIRCPPFRDDPESP